MNLKSLYKTSLKYSCDLESASLEEFCKEWMGKGGALKYANQELFIFKIINENKVLLKRLGHKQYLRPDVEMTYFPAFKTVHFTIMLKKRSIILPAISLGIFIVISLVSHSVSRLFEFIYDAKYTLLGGIVFYSLILLYRLYEERDLTKKDFEQELYYQRMEYEEL